MSQYSALPGGTFGPQPTIPMNLAYQGVDNHGNSTESNDSVMTQVPLPYHMHPSFAAPQQQQTSYAIPSQQYGNGSDRSRSMSVASLNPNSAPFNPAAGGYGGGYEYNQAPVDMQAFSNNSQAPLTGLIGQGLSYEEQQYVNNSNFAQNNMINLGASLGAQYPMPGQYDNYANQYDMNQYQPPPGYALPGMNGTNSSFGMNGMNGTNDTNSSFGSTQYTHAPTASFSSTGTQAYNQMNYGGMPQNNGHAPYSQPRYVQQGQGRYQQQQLGPYGNASAQDYVLPSNANRGKVPARFPDTNNTQTRQAQQNNGRRSRASNNSRLSNAFSSLNTGINGQQAYLPRGEGVWNAAAATTSFNTAIDSTPTQSKTSHASVAETQSQASLIASTAPSLVDSEAHGVEAEEPTPTARSRHPLGFASELRPSAHNLHDSTTGPNTDPAHRNTQEWLSKVQESREPPPKMMSLLNEHIGGHAAMMARKHISNDPFITPTRNSSTAVVRMAPPPVFDSPFAPQQLMASYSGGLVGRLNQGMSVPLRTLTSNGKERPSIEKALNLEFLPFTEYCARAKPRGEFGVVRLRNIPYATNRPEILAFIGRNARIIDEKDHEPIHIIMERVTSKTLDAFIEFVSLGEAVAAVTRFENNRHGGRGGRLGPRHIEMELSSQEALMSELFPKAKNVVWGDGRPMILETNPEDKYNSGFCGFLSKEELVMLLKHVESPQRSPFSKECPQRPFECLISTLLKYPWRMTHHITIEDREQLFNVTIRMLQLLAERLEHLKSPTEHEIHLTPMLYKRVWRAALKCPGFTPTQKDSVVVTCNLDPEIAQELGVPLFAADWKYLWTIGPKTGIPHDIILYYAAIIREATENHQQLTLAEKSALGEVELEPKLFGELNTYFNHPKDMKVFAHCTLAQVALNEWAGIETVLRKALGPQITQ